MSPWLDLCRAAVRDVEAVLASMPTREERERPVGRGQGGDITAALDEAAERVVLAHFDRPDVRIDREFPRWMACGRWPSRSCWSAMAVFPA